MINKETLDKIIDGLSGANHVCDKEGDIAIIKERSDKQEGHNKDIFVTLSDHTKKLDKISGGLGVIKFLGVGVIVTIIAQVLITTNTQSYLKQQTREALKHINTTSKFSMLVTNKGNEDYYGYIRQKEK